MSSTSKLHTCLVCSSQTKHAHLGILLCRACKIFYGRAQQKKRPRVCRAGTNNCSHKCKHCRFAHITRLLQGNGKGKEKKEETESSHGSPIQSEIKGIESIPSTSQSDPLENFLNLTQFDSQGAPRLGRLVCPPSFNGGNSFLNRIRYSYSMMAVSRRATELTALHPNLHPVHTSNGTFPLIPATLTTANVTSRSLVTSLFDFCTAAFEEFASLSLQQKWFLLKNFKYSFFSLESAYRIYRDHADAPPMIFMSQTTYLTQEISSDFVGPIAEGIRSDSKKYMSIYILGDCQSCRDVIVRLKPTEDEFLALLALCCWNLENTEAEPNLLTIGESIKRKVMSELEDIYKRKGKIEYVPRIGEILAITTFFQITADAMPFKLEMLRLHNIIDEDTFIYSVNKN